MEKNLVFNRNSFRLSCESKLLINITKNKLLNIFINVFTNKFYAVIRLIVSNIFSATKFVFYAKGPKF